MIHHLLDVDGVFTYVPMQNNPSNKNDIASETHTVDVQDQVTPWLGKRQGKSTMSETKGDKTNIHKDNYLR